ncbi:MAG: hypothetical protein M0R66_06815 [Candidatus Omnitrophica bacterium]|jgi:hypothetical protein|nr:hypothetical protein [Candidatus Omnitrophota bacterium]
MARKPAIPAETLGDWFKEHLAGALNWTDLVARASEYAPGKISHARLSRLFIAWRRDQAKAAGKIGSNAPAPVAKRRAASHGGKAVGGAAAELRGAKGTQGAAWKRGVLVPLDEFDNLLGRLEDAATNLCGVVAQLARRLGE